MLVRSRAKWVLSRLLAQVRRQTLAQRVVLEAILRQPTRCRRRRWGGGRLRRHRSGGGRSLVTEPVGKPTGSHFCKERHMFNGNGLHKDTPWLWVLVYRFVVLA